ncbi:MAG: HEPN domain-containing protein [Bacteroidales bacterium]|jgi:HEPN domain-containing protein|nr:HEPN domain-containing protein [Bacteroidales bacterium]
MNINDDIVRLWMMKAKHDLDTAHLVSISLPEYDDTIAFHCQQVIEKTLKAYLVFLDIDFKPVHDLGYLITLIGTKDPSIDEFYDAVDEISRFAVQIRYPDTIIHLTQKEISAALDLADQIFIFVGDKVKLIM